LWLKILSGLFSTGKEAYIHGPRFNNRWTDLINSISFSNEIDHLRTTSWCLSVFWGV
jgi:hypothetical protein